MKRRKQTVGLIYRSSNHADALQAVHGLLGRLLRFMKLFSYLRASLDALGLS